jgi:hypothetical protein
VKSKPGQSIRFKVEPMKMYSDPPIPRALTATARLLVLVLLMTAMAAPVLRAAEISFQVAKDATLLQGLIVPDSQSLGGGYVGFDFWDEFSHGDIFAPLYDAGPKRITGIELAYFDYAPLDAGHALAALNVDLTFQTNLASTGVLNLSDSSGAANGTLDLFNSIIGPDLGAMLADYRFDPVLGAAEDPVIMGISSNDSGFTDVSGAASYRITITVEEPADLPEPHVVVLLGLGVAVWRWFLGLGPVPVVVIS